MLGLKRGTVKLQAYSEEWPNLFELEKNRILSLVDININAIEHVGSTSIPGLKAKPIIDIAIELDSHIELEKMIEPMVNAGYTYFGEREIADDYCFMNGPESRRTHKVHVSLKGSKRLPDFLELRNKLRDSPILLKEYEDLKTGLAAKYPNDSKMYTQKKGDLIKRIIRS